MAFFPQASPPPTLGQVFRDGLDAYRDAAFKLAWARGSANSMTTDQQVADAFGITLSQAASFKAEVDSAVGKLLGGDAGVTCAQMKAAMDQLLNECG